MENNHVKRERKVSRKELAEHFKVTPQTVTNWLRNRIIPCYRAGRVLRFSIPAVEKALEKREASSNRKSRKVVA